MAAGKEEELVDYTEDVDDTVEIPGDDAAGGGASSGKKAKKGYSGMEAHSFRDFYLKPEILQAIARHGFEHPSEVQQECIPQAILGVDVLCQAQSGMGKTAVFVLSTLQQLDTSASSAGGVQVLVLCHTRELAFQIAKEYERFAVAMEGVRCEVLYGGVSVQVHKQMLATDPPQIVVGTPGRVLQLVNDKALKLDKVKHFVLDECDELLNKDALDMRRDIQAIFKAAPRDKQVMMFTATLSADTRAVCKKFMVNPVEITVDNESKLTLHGLQQHYIKLAENEKNKKLMDLFDVLDFNQVMVFVKTPPRAIALAHLLRQGNFPAKDLHSSMKQEERIQRFKDFKESKFRVLVSTNLTGRGIDVSKVNIVVNYDMPDNADTYLHRVGRAGRFGTKGLAITFVATEKDAEVLHKVQERFEVSIPPLPDTIDKSTYINAANA